MPAEGTFAGISPSLSLGKSFLGTEGDFVKQLLPFVIYTKARWAIGHPETKGRSLKQVTNRVDPGFYFQVTFTYRGVKVMSQPAELSLEQQFSLCSFKTQVSDMSREQAQEFLVKLYEQMMLRETMYRHFLKHHWGLEPNPGVE